MPCAMCAWSPPTAEISVAPISGRDGWLVRTALIDRIGDHLRRLGGDKRTDEYYWLNERNNPDVKAYLEAENRYTDSVLMPVKGLQEKLFAELKARIKEDDSSVPYFKNGYWYIMRYETGKEYPIFSRKKGDLNAADELLVDVNELSKGQSYCQIGGLSVSPDNQLLAFSVDYTGRNLFKL